MNKTTKEHILEVSFLLFLQKSYKAVTLKEIVEKAGVSKGAFYHYFKSKKELFEEVVTHFYLQMCTQNFEAYDQRSLKLFYKDVLVNIEKEFLSLRQIQNEELKFNINDFLLISEAIKLLPRFKAMMIEQHRTEFIYWKTAITKAKQKGEIKSSVDVEMAAKTFIYLGDGHGVNSLFKADNCTPDKLVEEIITLYDAYYEVLKS